MSDKIVNHFVLADGSTAKYDAGSLLNLDETVSLAGYAPDAKAVGDRLTDSSEELEDIRVGADGVTYPNAGDAVRGQIRDINSMEIEGYTKSEWQDVTSLSTLENNKYAEIVSGSINVVSNSAYKYYEIPVSEGEAYKTTGLTFFDIKPAVYVDDVGTVLDYAPTNRVTTPGTYVTVETTVPTGATKLIVNTSKYTPAIILKKKISFLKDAVNNVLTVKINTIEDADLTVVSHHGENDIIQTARVLSSDGYNNAVSPLTCSVFNVAQQTTKTIVDNEDDLTPILLSSGYIGAGHGYDRAKKITLTNHGKTYADIGSSWLSPSGHTWYIVRIIDADNFVMLSENSTDNNYDTFNETIGSPLTHVNGATHTGNIENFTQAMYLLTPIDMNHKKSVLLDGKTSVSTSGEYACNFVDVVDEYDIVNPQTIVPSILENKPSGGYTDNPSVNVGTDSFMYFSNVYRYLQDGTLLIFSLVDFDVDVWVSYWGLTQYAHKAPLNTFGGTCKRYVPNLLPVTVNGTNYDLRTPFDLANWSMTIDATNEYWEDANNPPDRIVELYTDGNGDYVNGYAVGYLPIGMGEPSARKTNINNAMQLYYTKKCYPHFVDRYGSVGYKWNAYSLFEGVAYRKPLLDVGDVHTDAYVIPYGEKCYIFADYHSVADERIKVPSEYIGKPITVLNKTSNVTVYGTLATDEIHIRVASNNPMYGFAVIQIG